jgi:NAD(P)-dependent dehydrogenase (short-subunit alcohol dehydrogenase family)
MAPALTRLCAATALAVSRYGGPARRRVDSRSRVAASMPRRLSVRRRSSASSLLIRQIRVMTPIEAVVTFLASPSAGHLTGQVIHVNGGAYLGL